MQRSHLVSTERCLTILARILAGYHGCEVLFQHAPTAYTDKRTIVIPQQWVTGAPDDAVLLEMLIDHEAVGHILHSDFDEGRLTAQWGDMKRVTPLAMHLFRAMEDLRIEAAAMRRLPGVSRSLQAGLKVLTTKHGFFAPPPSGVVPEKIHPGQILGRAVLIHGRAALLTGQQEVLGTAAAQWTQLAEGCFGSVWDDIWRVVEKSVSARTSLEVIDLAKRIHRMLTRQETPEDKKSKDDERKQVGLGSGKTEPSGGAEESGADQGSEDGVPGDSDPSQKNRPSGQPDSKGPGPTPTTPDARNEAVTPGATAPVDPEPDASVLDAMLKASDSKDADLGPADLGEIISKALNHSPTVGNTLGQTGGFAGHGAGVQVDPEPGRAADAVQSLAAGYANRLMAEMETLLEARVKVDIKHREFGRRIDPARLHQVAVRDGRIFRKKIENEALSTAAWMVTDASGSMGSNFLDAGDVTYRQSTQALLLCLGRLLEQFDVPFGATVFADNFAHLKTFDRSWRAAEANFRCPVGSGTMTGAAMIDAIVALATAMQDRKLLLVITDGDAYDQTVVQAAYAEARMHGIEVVTIFLGSGGKTADFLRSNDLPVTATTLHGRVQQTVLTALETALLAFAQES